MPAAHIEFYGGPLDGKQEIFPVAMATYELVTADKRRHLYRLKCVLGNVPVKLPGGRYAMDYAGVVEASPNDKNP